MDFAVCLCITDPSIQPNIARPAQLFYNAFLESISHQIRLYICRHDASLRGAPPLPPLRVLHERTGRAVGRYQAPAGLVRERGGRPEREPEPH